MRLHFKIFICDTQALFRAQVLKVCRIPDPTACLKLLASYIYFCYTFSAVAKSFIAKSFIAKSFIAKSKSG